MARKKKTAAPADAPPPAPTPPHHRPAVLLALAGMIRMGEVSRLRHWTHERIANALYTGFERLSGPQNWSASQIKRAFLAAVQAVHDEVMRLHLDGHAVEAAPDGPPPPPEKVWNPHAPLPSVSYDGLPLESEADKPTGDAPAA